MKLGIFIPGRLSSQRLPNKLILPIGDSCLWEMACSLLNEISSDYDKYILTEEGLLADIARKYDSLKVIVRDPDTGKTDGPLKYIFKDLRDVENTHLMFLNPCMSFLSLETLHICLKRFEEENMSYATSVKPYSNWLFNEEGTSVTPINYLRLTTKEVNGLWQTAHCFHIFDKEAFFLDGCMLKEGHGLIPVPVSQTIDVDTYEDYEFVRWKHEICN